MNSLKRLFAASFAGWCLALAGFLCGHSVQAAQAPTITDMKDLAMDEDTVSPTIFFTIGDPDTPVGQLQLVRLTSNTNIVRVSDMTLGGSGAERTLKISPQPNAFGTVVLGIRVSDGQQEVADTFTLTVRSANDLPSMDPLFDRTIPEDGATAELPVVVGDLETPSANLTLSGNSDNLALVPPSAFKFGGQGANRTVVVTPAPDQSGIANVTITVSDGQDTAARTFRLNVIAVDDGPTVSPIADVVTDEDTTSAPIPFWFGDIDTPAADVIVTAFPDDGVLLPPELFVLKGTGTNRTLTVTPRQNRSGSTKVTVRINDGSLHPTNRVFNLQVRPVNDLPAMTPVDDAVTNEDTTKVVNTVVTDVDNVVDNVEVVGFSDNQSVLPDSGIRGARNGGLWGIALTPAPNATGVARVTLVATDPAGGKTTNSFNLTVAPIDDPPEISQIPDQIADEDTVIGPLLWRIVDVDTPVESLAITRSSTFQQIVADDGIVIQGTGTNRLVRIVPQPNASGSTTITLTVSDGTTVKRINFQATFNAANDRPRISAIADQTILRNRNTGPLAFTIFDVETPAQGLTLDVASFNTNLVAKSGIVLAGTGTNRTVTVTPLANRTGTARIAIGVTDQGGAAAVSSFTLNVVGAVDPPRITVSPVSKNLRLGEELLLEVTADGEGPFTYQWRFKGKAIEGATERTFRIPAIALENAGEFDVVVTNAGGSTASQKSTVAVKEYDFGDAPGYAIAANPIFAGSHLGAGVTADTAPPATDSMDDGTAFPVLLLGNQANIIVNASSPVAGPNAGYLNAWVDFNQNQVFGDVANEWVIHNVHLVKGPNNLSFPVPGTIPTGSTWARLRYASESGFGPSGIEPTYTGEVEDYPVTVQSDTTGGGGGNCVDCDFGDAPDTYKTTLAAGGAYHITKALAQGLPFVGLGPVVDIEPNGAPGANADGDDLNDSNPVPPPNVDDEDGVRFRSALVAGQTGVVEVVTRSSNLKYLFLNAWIDFGIDGTFSNAVDRIFSGRRVLAGTNVLTFPIPATARPGASYARFRLTGGEELQSPTRVVDYFGGAPNGEVEDLKVTLEAGQPEVVKDFGDAPETVGKLTTGFPTTLVRTGAWHTVLSGFYLGKSIDGEGDGQPQLQLLGDDSNGDDEDGITFTGAIVSGGTTQVQVEASVPAGQTAFVDAWIDYNGDLDWDDAGEKVLSSRLVVNGFQTFNLTIPTGLRAGPVASRWRLSKQGGLDYKGGGGDGEVEDHRLTITVSQSNPCSLSCLGKDFWLAFPGNYSFAVEPVSLDISIVGPSGTTGTINGLNSANVRINTPFTIPANGVYRATLANSSDLGDLNDGIAPKGVHVTASANVGVFAVSKVLQSTDGYLGLTTEALGTEYVVGTYGNVHGGVPELNGTQFAVVASQANTVVTIVPSYLTGLHVPGTPYSVTLTNAGDCYQLRNTSDSPADLSGTSILSDKPVGVFGSHRIANVNSTDVFFADYLVEQLLPVSRWSTEFYTTPLATRSEGDVFRVISSQPDTTVVVGSDALVLAEAGEVLELTLTSATKITADKPVQVLQFATSSDVDGVTNADPFMVTVPARAHWSTSHAFATPASGFSSYYANVVAPSTTTGTVKLDGIVVTGWSTISGTAYSWASVALSAGGHAITADKEVGVIVYGWGLYESFGYAACLFFGDTTPPTGSVDITTLTVRTTAQSCTVSIPDLRDHVSAEDNCNGEVFVEQTPAPGTDVPPGDYDIQLWAIDGKGNRAVWHVAYHVIDAGLNQQEVDHLPADLVIRCNGERGAAGFWNAYTELGCTRLPATTVPPSGTVFPPGTTNVVTVTFPPTPLHPAVRVGTFKVIVDCTRKRDVKINLPTIDPTGAREIVVEWEDGSNVALQVANQPEGPWIDVPNARARFAIKIANERGKFYRLIER